MFVKRGLIEDVYVNALQRLNDKVKSKSILTES